MGFNVAAAKRGYSIRGVKSLFIDGVMESGEWEGVLDATATPAKYVTLASGVAGPTVYIMNDAKFLYVAFDSVSVDSFVAFNIYKAGTHSPNRIDIPLINSDGKKMWDNLADTVGDSSFSSYSRHEPSYLFEGARGEDTEFKVPLCPNITSNYPVLKLSAGDTVVVGFVFVTVGTAYIYPSDLSSADITTYQSLTLTG